MKKGSRFVYQKVAEELRQKIMLNEFESGRLPSERELGSHYGINRLTLRKAIKLLENDKLVYRDATRGTFIGAGKQLKAGNKIIALVLVGRSRIDRIHSITIMEFEQQVKLYHSNMMLFSVKDESEVDTILAGPVRNGLLAGIIVAGLMTPGVIDKIRSLGLPLVLFGHLLYQSPVENECDRIYPDSVAYSYDAVKYLVKRNATRIALVNGPGYQWLLNVYQGYMRGLIESGQKYDESLVIKCETESTSIASQAADSLLSLKPDAVFFATERLAAVVIEKLRQKEVAFLKQLQLITIGTEYSEFPGVDHINIVSVNWHKMVRTTLELLFSRIENPHFPARYKDAVFEIIH